MLESKKEEKARKRRMSQAKVQWTLGKLGKMVLPFVDDWENLVGATATSDDVQCRNGHMIRMQEGIEVKVSSWELPIPKMTRQEYSEDRKGMQKESKITKMHTVELADVWHREEVHEEV